jgi:DeoR family suf operon transcriptional repressor
MPLHSSSLAAHKGLRGDILLALKRAQPLTARQLAERLDVSPNAVRHHLKELEAERLVVYGRVQRGVGAPTFAYRLSADGEASFPRAYEDALTGLLEHVEEKVGRGAAVEMFEQRYAELTRRLAAELEGAEPAARLARVVELLSASGYMAEWDERAGAFRLAEHNCAIRAVAERFPEVCAAEERFLERVLGAAVQRVQHIPGGCNACEYAITFTKPSEERA